MKEFLEPRLEVLQFYTEEILLESWIVDDDENANTGGGVVTPVVPVG